MTENWMIGAGLTLYRQETLKDRLVPGTMKKGEETILLPTTKWGEKLGPSRISPPRRKHPLT